MKGAQSISTVWCAADLPRVGTGAVQRLRATARDEGARIMPPGRGAGRPHPPGARSLTVSWRGVPESVGRSRGSAPRRSGAAVNAGARPPGPAPRGPRARPEGTRRHDHHGGPRCDVGNGHDGHGDHSVPVVCTTECIGLHAAKSGSRFEALEPPRTLRRHWQRRGLWAASPTTTGRTIWPTIFNRRSRSSASKAPRASCGSPKATASLSASSAAEGECLVGAELRHARSSAWPCSYNEHWMLERYDYRSPAQVRRDLVG